MLLFAQPFCSFILISTINFHSFGSILTTDSTLYTNLSIPKNFIIRLVVIPTLPNFLNWLIIVEVLQFDLAI